MQLLDVASVGTDYQHRWPDGSTEQYPSWIEYRARSADGDHTVRIAFGERDTYGRQRRRVLVLIDDHLHAEFLGADDFDRTGDILSEIKVPGDGALRRCRYPDEVVPERYGGLPVLGLPTRVSGPGVPNAWAVVANISDHRTILALAALRRVERARKGAG
jgi:hypothetical protein